MKAQTTRTLNPLPFQDLEPHRFEDLVRQLAYDLRSWKSLEATGRSGSDDGLDIRAIEAMPATGETDERADELIDESPQVFKDNLWIFQCKRERALTPKRISGVIEDSLSSLSAPPHGFVLAIACDISKKARDVFREEMVKRRIEEYAIWAKGELEDMLFQPKNDRLLFAYFGISLEPRRKSLATSLRSKISKKKQLASMLGDDADGRLVLLRDPTDDRYPNDPPAGDPWPRWILCRAESLKNPDAMMIRRSEHLAALSPDGKQWDAIFSFDSGRDTFEMELRSHQAWAVGEYPDRDKARDFWIEHIPESERAKVVVFQFVPIDRIIALDLDGDGYYPIPHVLIEFEPVKGPFVGERTQVLSGVSSFRSNIDIVMTEENRASIFPDPLPENVDSFLKAFDQTGAKSKAMDKSVKERFGNFLNAVRSFESTNKVLPQLDSLKLNPGTLEFRTWQNNVVLPTFSEFANKLRSAGHSAWITFRPIEAASPERGDEFIQLKFKLRPIEASSDAPFRQAGYLKFTKTYNGVKTESLPDGSLATSGRYVAPAPQPLGQMTKEFVEAQMIAVLERRLTEKY